MLGHSNVNNALSLNTPRFFFSVFGKHLLFVNGFLETMKDDMPTKKPNMPMDIYHYKRFSHKTLFSTPWRNI
jgi:hypothetical protein